MFRQKGFAPILIVIIAVVLLGGIALLSAKFKSGLNKATNTDIL